MDVVTMMSLNGFWRSVMKLSGFAHSCCRLGCLTPLNSWLIQKWLFSYRDQHFLYQNVYFCCKVVYCNIRLNGDWFAFGASFKWPFEELQFLVLAWFCIQFFSSRGYHLKYISDLQLHFETSRPLRSSGTCLLSVPRVRTKHEEAAFSFYAP